MRQLSKRLTYANVMSSIAVFLVLGGATALAAGLAKNSVGSKQLKANAVTAKKIKKNAVTNKKIKANAVTGAKVKDASLSGADINLASLGTVPSAENANNAANLNGLKTLAGSASENTLTVLLSTGQFDVVGICDENSDFSPPGFEPNIGTSIGIINRGQNGGVADTYDDDDIDFNIGDGVAFDFIDAGDPGTAVLPNGHWIHVLGGTITEPGSNPNFGGNCTFHAVAFFG